jgi:translation initiation factor IF-1
MHYTRWFRHGDPLTVLPHSPPPPPKRGRRKPSVPCSVDGCDRVAHCRGWCTRHYHAWLRNGDPVKPAPRKLPAKRTHCKYRHPLSGNNIRVYQRPDGRSYRICRACDNRRSKAYQRTKQRTRQPSTLKEQP